MQTLHRKPRVFLSHSKKDVAFIRRLAADLRGCLCETWIDEVEIRHGKPWLDEIFASGLPSCEVVLCYITENSIQSAMVKKEIDARVIERLANDRVTLLMYVSAPHLREELRLDLQALQIPVLNDEKYADLLPRIVAEIWRSFTDVAVAQAIQGEKVRRLELELKVKDLESSLSVGIFSDAEQAEFSAIWKQIDIKFESKVAVKIRNGKDVESEDVCSVSYGLLYRHVMRQQTIKPSRHGMAYRIGQDYMSIKSIDKETHDANAEFPIDFQTQFLRFGFLQRMPRHVIPHEISIIDSMRARFELVFTAKFDRFNFWLDSMFGEPNATELVLEVG